MTVPQASQGAASVGAHQYFRTAEPPFRSRTGKRRAALDTFKLIAEVVKSLAYKLARIVTGRPARATRNAPATHLDPATTFHKRASAPDGPLTGSATHLAPATAFHKSASALDVSLTRSATHLAPATAFHKSASAPDVSLTRAATQIDPATAFHQWAFAPDGPLTGLERLGREIRAEPIVSPERNDDRQKRSINFLMDLDAGTNRLVNDEAQRKDILLSVLARCLADTPGYLCQAMSYAEPCRGPSTPWRDVLQEHNDTRFDNTVQELAALLLPPLEKALCKARDAYATRRELEQNRAQADQDFAYLLGVMLVPFLAAEGQAAKRWTEMANVLHVHGDSPPSYLLSAGEQGDVDDFQQAWKEILRQVTALEDGIDKIAQALALSVNAPEELAKRRDASLLASLNQCESWQQLSQADAALNWMMFTDESRTQTAAMLDLDPDLET